MYLTTKFASYHKMKLYLLREYFQRNLVQHTQGNNILHQEFLFHYRLLLFLSLLESK